MGPRKKAKSSQAPTPAPSESTNTPTPADSNTPTASTASISQSSTSVPSDSPSSAPPAPAEPQPDAPPAAPETKAQPVKKWYNGNTWRAKASPVAQVARESISVAGGATSELLQESKDKLANGPPGRYMSRSMRRSSAKSVALPASITKVDVTSAGNGSGTEVPAKVDQRIPSDGESKEPEETRKEDPPLPPEPVIGTKLDGTEEAKTDGEETASQKGTSRPASTYYSWRGWWSKPDGDAADGTAKEDTGGAVEASKAAETPLPTVTPSEELSKPALLGPEDKVKGQPGTEETAQEGVKPASSAQQSSRGWFGLWSTAQNAKNALSQTAATTDNLNQEPGTEGSPQNEASAPLNNVKVSDHQSFETASDPNRTSTKTGKSSGWAFWSKTSAADGKESDSESTRKQVGELAVADTPSQSHPEAAQFNEERSSPKSKSKKAKQTSQAPKEPPVAAAAAANKTVDSTLFESAPATVKQPERALAKPTPPANPNLLLPPFRGTYQLAQTPSYFQQVLRYFQSTDGLTNHVNILPTPLRPKQALAIGVHGYFPAPVIRTVLGQPTGTSIRFANAAATAIKSWAEQHNHSLDIEKVALEGEGMIQDRVDTLWKLLLNWIEQIKNADFILVACHSQGVPVAIMLVAKLIMFGCISNARIGVCAMAGVNLGPFPDYKSRFFGGGSASELFEFSNPESKVSKMYEGALDLALRHGVRIVYVGSIDDQLVSLESSTFSIVSHPYIYRAVFVDGRIHAPDFITTLVGFALKLRNLGISDHGLIRELSPALAGSLYSGEGHSRIYDDPAVYELAVEHALETTTIVGREVQLEVKKYEVPTSATTNPYFLPWAMRGVLEEEFVKRELRDETDKLLGLFDEWKPVSKVLKDVKFRLEAVRSKL